MATQHRGSQFGLPLEPKIATMSPIAKALAFLLLLAAPVLAQDHFHGGPPAAGFGPSYDVSFGYSYLTASTPGAGRVNLNGLNAGGHMDFFQRWGATVDAGYVRTGNVLGTGNGGYILTFLGGPVFYPVQHGSTRVFVHALGGAGLVDSAVPTSGTTYLHGWVARYAYAVGGGVERSIAGRFGIRVKADYLRTAFVDSADAVQLQNNLRLTMGLVFRLKEGRW